MIYLAMWSCVTGALLILLSPCVSSQNASSVATVSTSVNQSLSFSAVSKETPNTVLTNLTTSISASSGDGYLGYSSVYRTPVVEDELSAQNTPTLAAVSAQASWSLLSSTPSVNMMPSIFSGGMFSLPVSHVATAMDTLLSLSFLTEMSEPPSLLQSSTQPLMSSASVYDDVSRSKPLISAWISDLLSDSEVVLSTDVHDFTASAWPHSSIPASLKMTEGTALMPSNAIETSLGSLTSGESLNFMMTSNSFILSSLDSASLSSDSGELIASDMYMSADVVNMSVLMTAYNLVSTTESWLESSAMSPEELTTPTSFPSILETSVVESWSAVMELSSLSTALYSSLLTRGSSSASHSLLFALFSNVSLELLPGYSTTAFSESMASFGLDSTSGSTVAWQTNPLAVIHTSTVLDYEYSTAHTARETTVTLSPIGVTMVGVPDLTHPAVYTSTASLVMGLTSTDDNNPASASLTDYLSSLLVPSGSHEVHSFSSADSLQPSQNSHFSEPVLTGTLPAMTSVTPSLLSVSISASDWFDNSTTDSSTNLPNTSHVQASTLKPTSEWLLNTSDALAPYWVKTVIKVPLSEDEQSVQFRREMETKLAGILNEALQRLASILSGTYKPLRRRRAVTVNNATVQVTNISRADPVETSHTTLVYYMIEGNTAGAITAADRTAGLMQLFSDQELAIKFGYEVVVKAEVYVKPPPAKEQKLWIIGAVIGGVAGLVILIWCFLFIYFKCTRPPKKIPSQRPPHPTKIADVDQLDYKGRDVKGFDYARTEVGLESELDRQNVPEYYRRYPMGSTDLEGMYSPGETPPPPFRGHHPSSGSAKRGPKGEPPYPPPAPPSNGFIHPISSKENQAKSTKTEKKTRNDEACSTDQDTEDTQGSRRSEDRKPLSSKKGRLSHKHKHSGHHADQFEHVSKMGRVDDPEMLVPPTRTTIHAIKAPVLENRPDDDTLPEIPPEKDIKETLQQKAEIERWRNKQRQRERSGQNKHQKARAKENAGRHHPKDHNNEKTPTGEQPSKPKRKKKKPQQKPVAKNIPAEDNIEMTPVYDHQVIQPVIASMPQAPCLPHLESDSSDDGLEPASSSRDRQLVSALLDEAFAMATPTPTINLPEEPKHPAPQLTLSSAAQQTPVYVTPASTQTGKTSTMWNPYEAADQAAYLVPPGQIVNSGSRSPSLRGGEQKHPRPSPHSTHQYTNPAYMADLPTTAGLQPIQSSDINDSSTPRYGTNPANGFVPNSPRAFTPYKKPAWTDLTPSVWDDPDGTLPAEHRFGGRQPAGGAAGQPRSRPSDKSTGRPRAAKPTRHEDADDEIDIVTDVMKNGASSQSLIASIREEIERLAKRPQDNRTQQKPIT